MKIAKRAAAVSPSLTLEITAKAKKMKADGLEVVSFGAGEPDFNTPDYIIEAAKSALDKGMTKYTPASGTAELRAAIAEKLLKDNGISYNPADIVVSNGAKHALMNAFFALVDEGDEVILPVPYWLTYPELIKLAGGVPVYAETDKSNGYKLTPEILEKYITPKTAALLLNNPVNPSGSVYSEAEIKALAKALESYPEVYVIADEIYEKLTYGADFYSFAAVSEDIKKRTVLVNGVSKSYSMTGWRIGYTASDTKVAKAISGMQSHMTSNPNSIAQYATLVALTHNEGGEFLKLMKETFDRRRKRITAQLDKIGLNYVNPEGAFYVMADVSPLFGKSLSGKKIQSAMDVAALLIDEERVAVIPCESFGAADYIRLSYAISDEDIVKGVSKIGSLIGKLN